MIEAKHSAPFELVFERYAANLIARRFHALWVRGNVSSAPEPTLLVMQHVAWWDPIVLFHLTRAWFPRGAVHYAMMDESNLKKYPFFRWIGAFGVDRSSKSAGLASVRYTLARLREPRTRVVVFPQGRQYPADVRPLRCEAGATWVAARAGVRVVPIALRYDFLEDEYPEAFVSIGPAAHVESRRARDGVDPIEAMLTAEADGLRDAILRGEFQGFTKLVKGRGERDPRPWE